MGKVLVCCDNSLTSQHSPVALLVRYMQPCGSNMSPCAIRRCPSIWSHPPELLGWGHVSPAAYGLTDQAFQKCLRRKTGPAQEMVLPVNRVDREWQTSLTNVKRRGPLRQPGWGQFPKVLKENCLSENTCAHYVQMYLWLSAC